MMWKQLYNFAEDVAVDTNTDVYSSWVERLNVVENVNSPQINL